MNYYRSKSNATVVRVLDEANDVVHIETYNGQPDNQDYVRREYFDEQYVKCDDSEVLHTYFIYSFSKVGDEWELDNVLCNMYSSEYMKELIYKGEEVGYFLTATNNNVNSVLNAFREYENVHSL